MSKIPDDILRQLDNLSPGDREKVALDAIRLWMKDRSPGPDWDSDEKLPVLTRNDAYRIVVDPARAKEWENWTYQYFPFLQAALDALSPSSPSPGPAQPYSGPDWADEEAWRRGMEKWLKGENLSSSERRAHDFIEGTIPGRRVRLGGAGEAFRGTWVVLAVHGGLAWVKPADAVSEAAFAHWGVTGRKFLKVRQDALIPIVKPVGEGLHPDDYPDTTADEMDIGRWYNDLDNHDADDVLQSTGLYPRVSSSYGWDELSDEDQQTIIHYIRNGAPVTDHEVEYWFNDIDKDVAEDIGVMDNPDAWVDMKTEDEDWVDLTDVGRRMVRDYYLRNRAAGRQHGTEPSSPAPSSAPPPGNFDAIWRLGREKWLRGESSNRRADGSREELAECSD